MLVCCPGGSGQADLPDCGRDSGTLRQELWERVRPRLPPQLQQGRSAVEVLEEPTGEHGELAAEVFHEETSVKTGPGAVAVGDGGVHEPGRR